MGKREERIWRRVRCTRKRRLQVEKGARKGEREREKENAEKRKKATVVIAVAVVQQQRQLLQLLAVRSKSNLLEEFKGEKA